MKILLITFAILSSVSFAQTTTSNPVASNPVFTSLKDVMKDMSIKLRTIAAQVNDNTKNSESEKIALAFVDSVTLSKNFVPDTAPDQASKDLFQKMIDDTIVLGKQLSDAFHQNDNVKANEILNKLLQQKKDGHSKFN